jgi:hypothetical protein
MDICVKTGKRMYSAREANSAKNSAGNLHHTKQIPLRAYYCKHCGAYHLTHFRHFKKMGEKSTKYWYKKAKENYKNFNEDYEELK